jgi:ZIP family zinc transporter
MLEAFAWGFIAASSLLIGAVIALRLPVSKLVLGLTMAFGAGVLISAVAYDLVLEAFTTADGNGVVGLGLLAGALTFFAGDMIIDRKGGQDRKRSSGAQASGAALAIVLGVVLDGIPESIVLGLTLIDGGGVSVAVLAAIFMSNLPEAIAATTGLAASGWQPRKLYGLWSSVALASAIAAGIGFVVFDDASPDTIAFVNAFAAGAILTMLADTMMPEAFEHGGKYVGLATTLGFMAAFFLVTIE